MFKIICCIIGAFIGAGFSSGKEIYLFFVEYKSLGILGLIITCIFFEIIIRKSLEIIRCNAINNYGEFLDVIIKNNAIKNIIIKTMNIFFLVSFCVMISGFCEFLYQEFFIGKNFSYCFILFFCYLALKKNINGIIKINDFFIPILIIIILYFGVNKINNYGIIFSAENKFGKINLKFLFDAILYSNYNLLIIIPVLIGLKKYITSTTKIKYISNLVSGVIFILALILYTIVFQAQYVDSIDVRNLEMPIVFIVGREGIAYKFIYGMIIGIAIYTTALASGYSYLQISSSNLYLIWKIIFLILGSFLAVKVGFSKLIEISYPLFGAIGVWQSINILKKELFLKWSEPQLVHLSKNSS